VLHDSDEYGVVRWPLADLARASGTSARLVRELVDKGVLKGSDTSAQPFVYRPHHAGTAGPPVVLIDATHGTPCWYSSRLVRDEWVRLRRGVATQFNADKQPPGRTPKPAPKPAPEPAPKPPIGERQGDGSTSSSASSANTPISPQGGKRSAAVGLTAWLDDLKARGEKPIPEADLVFAYANGVGIPSEFLRLAWLEFRHRNIQPDAKRYRDWRSVFRKAVRANWLKLWYVDGASNTYALTTAGHQAQRAHDERPTA